MKRPSMFKTRVFETVNHLSNISDLGSAPIVRVYYPASYPARPPDVWHIDSNSSPDFYSRVHYLFHQHGA